MRRALLALAALLVALPLLALGAAALFLDGEALKPRVVEAAERATGERVAVARLAVGLFPPSATAEGVVVGAPDAPLASLRRAEVALALLPLLSGRVELRRVAADGVELRPLAPRAPRPPAAIPAPPAPPPPEPRRAAVALGEVRLSDVAVHLGGAGEPLRLARATLSPEGALAASLVARGEAVEATGRIPPGLGDGPFALRLALPGGAVATAEGERRGPALSGRVAAEAPALAALSTLAGAALPPLERVALRAEGAWDGAALRLASAELRAAGGAVGPVRVAELRAAAAAPDRPLEIAARGAVEGREVALSGAGPSLAALLGGGALPVDLRLALPGGAASVAGPLPLPGRPGGALAVEARLADLSVLGPAAPRATDLRLSGQARPEGEGAWRIAGLSVESSAGDLAADVVVRTAPRVGVSGRVESRRLDLDALRAAPAPAVGPAAPPPAQPPPGGPPRLFPDSPVPFAALRGFDADLAFRLGELRSGGSAYRDVEGRFANEAGRARLDPFAATLPGGRVSLRAAADATLAPPALQVAGGGEGLDLAALLPGAEVQGRGDLQLDLRAQGETLRALAATLTGRAGLAVVDGRLGAGLSRGLLAGLPGAPGGALPLACLAVLAEADRGVVRPRVAYLESGLGRIAAEGAVDLREETLALRLSTDLRVGPLRVRAPVPLTGTLLAPRLDWGDAARAALAGDLGQQADRLLPGLGQALRQGGAPAAPALPECGPALAQARFGRAGPAPRPTPPQAAPQAPAPAVDQLLRSLLGR